MKVSIDGKDYWRDAEGKLVPDELVRDIDKERDALIIELSNRAVELQKEMKAFKRRVFGDVSALVSLSAEKYGAKIGGPKGNVTLYSYDGAFKLQVAVQHNLRFDERVHAAKALIDECLQEWSEGAKPEIKALIDNAFEVDKEGNLSAGKILSLRRVDIKDERWIQAMQAISDSLQVVDSKDYIRFYRRDESGKYQSISLDMAGV